MLRTFFYDHHPHYHLKLFPTTTTFGEIFLNHIVAYSFTNTMVSAQFLRNTFKYNYSPIYSLDWMHCYNVVCRAIRTWGGGGGGQLPHSSN